MHDDNCKVKSGNGRLYQYANDIDGNIGDIKVLQKTYIPSNGVNIKREDNVISKNNVLAVVKNVTRTTVNVEIVNILGGSGSSYILPPATPTALGGIIAEKADIKDTQEVRIGSDNKLYTYPSSLFTRDNIMAGENITLENMGNTNVRISATGELSSSWGSINGNIKTQKDLAEWILRGSSYKEDMRFEIAELAIGSSVQYVMIDLGVLVSYLFSNDLYIETENKDGESGYISITSSPEGMVKDVVVFENGTEVNLIKDGELNYFQSYLYPLSMATVTNITGNIPPFNSQGVFIKQVSNDTVVEWGSIDGEVYNQSDLVPLFNSNALKADKIITGILNGDTVEGSFYINLEQLNENKAWNYGQSICTIYYGKGDEAFLVVNLSDDDKITSWLNINGQPRDLIINGEISDEYKLQGYFSVDLGYASFSYDNAFDVQGQYVLYTEKNLSDVNDVAESNKQNIGELSALNAPANNLVEAINNINVGGVEHTNFYRLNRDFAFKNIGEVNDDCFVSDLVNEITNEAVAYSELKIGDMVYDLDGGVESVVISIQEKDGYNAVFSSRVILSQSQTSASNSISYQCLPVINSNIVKDFIPGSVAYFDYGQLYNLTSTEEANSFVDFTDIGAKLSSGYKNITLQITGLYDLFVYDFDEHTETIKCRIVDNLYPKQVEPALITNVIVAPDTEDGSLKVNVYGSNWNNVNNDVGKVYYTNGFNATTLFDGEDIEWHHDFVEFEISANIGSNVQVGVQVVTNDGKITQTFFAPYSYLPIPDAFPPAVVPDKDGFEDLADNFA